VCVRVSEIRVCVRVSEIRVCVRVRMINPTFNNFSVISWCSLLLVEKPGVHGEYH